MVLSDPHGHYEVAAGATLSLSLTGLDGRPAIRLADGARASLQHLSADSWSAQATLTATPRIAVRGAGYGLADWTVQVQPTLAPVAIWTAPPGAAPD